MVGCSYPGGWKEGGWQPQTSRLQAELPLQAVPKGWCWVLPGAMGLLAAAGLDLAVMEMGRLERAG